MAPATFAYGIVILFAQELEIFLRGVKLLHILFYKFNLGQSNAKKDAIDGVFLYFQNSYSAEQLLPVVSSD